MEEFFMCRTCLKPDNDECFQSIFAVDKRTDLGFSYAEIINIIIPSIHIAQNDGLPNKICSDCSQKVMELHQFVFDTENNENILQSGIMVAEDDSPSIDPTLGLTFDLPSIEDNPQNLSIKVEEIVVEANSEENSGNLQFFEDIPQRFPIEVEEIVLEANNEENSGMTDSPGHDPTLGLGPTFGLRFFEDTPQKLPIKVEEVDVEPNSEENSGNLQFFEDIPQRFPIEVEEIVFEANSEENSGMMDSPDHDPTLELGPTFGVRVFEDIPQNLPIQVEVDFETFSKENSEMTENTNSGIELKNDEGKYFRKQGMLRHEVNLEENKDNYFLSTSQINKVLRDKCSLANSNENLNNNQENKRFKKQCMPLHQMNFVEEEENYRIPNFQSNKVHHDESSLANSKENINNNEENERFKEQCMPHHQVNFDEEEENYRILNSLSNKVLHDKSSLANSNENINNNQENDRYKEKYMPYHQVNFNEDKENYWIPNSQSNNQVIRKKKYLGSQFQQEKELRCGYCDDKFIHQHLLKEHLKIHINKDSLECRNCLTEQDIQKHLKTQSVDEEFKCNICNKKFATKSNLLRHALVHLDKKSPFECELCKIKFKSSSGLKTHLKSHTITNKCEHCNAIFKYKCRLRQHMLLKHTSDDFGKNSECIICSRMYSVKGNLKAYSNLYCNNRSYKCYKKYEYESSLNYLFVADDKCLKCVDCSKCFTTRHYLKKHQLVHAAKRTLRHSKNH